MDDHPVHTAHPTQPPPKIDVLPKILLQIILADKWLEAQHSSMPPLPTSCNNLCFTFCMILLLCSWLSLTPTATESKKFNLKKFIKNATLPLGLIRMRVYCRLNVDYYVLCMYTLCCLARRLWISPRVVHGFLNLVLNILVHVNIKCYGEYWHFLAYNNGAYTYITAGADITDYLDL